MSTLTGLVDRDRPPWRWSENPITTFEGFQASVRHFIDHWQLVNSYLRSQGRPELVLPDGTTRDLLIRVFAAVPGRLAAQDAAFRHLGKVGAEHRHSTNELCRRVRELRDSVPCPPEGRSSISWRPVFEAVDAGGKRWISALGAAASAWEEENDRVAGAPLLLSDGFAVAEFRALVESFRMTGREVRAARRRWRGEFYRPTLLGTIGHWAGRYRTFVRFRLGLPESLREPFPFVHPRSYRPHEPSLLLSASQGPG